MTDDEWTVAMAYYGGLFKASVPSQGDADAWRTVYGHLTIDDTLAALRMLASQLGRKFGPATGEVLEAAAAIDKARRARTDAHHAPALPAGDVSLFAERNARRARVIGKLAVGALTRDGDPAEGWDDDPDLFAFHLDPLIDQMHRAHLEVRNALPSREELTAAHRARQRAAADPPIGAAP